jgi:molecular chaperone DnaK (HSP70)
MAAVHFTRRYGQHYFPYDLKAADNGRTEIVNSANSSETFSPEELVASILRYVRARGAHIHAVVPLCRCLPTGFQPRFRTVL